MTAEASFREKVLGVLKRIPEGRVMTYGQLAQVARQPGAARQVGYVMNSLMQSDLPWHRVINAQGRVSTHKLGFGDLQEGLLMAEGVIFVQGRCELAAYQWWPPEWLDTHLL